jgi:hypothetical protein
MAAKKGRPSAYSDEIADKICAGIMAGYGLRKICSAEGFPAISTIFYWLLDKEHPFSEQYARAREVQAELLADELIELADDDSRDVSGELQMPNGVAVQRSRLKVDTRKWVASKLLPKRYGDKVQQEVSGKDGGPLKVEVNRVEIVHIGSK